MNSVLDVTKKRRSRPCVLIAATVAAIALGRTGAMTSVSAFTSTPSPFSSVSRTQRQSELFGSSTSDDSEDKKLTIETVTDANMDTLLNPSSNLPVLVDAFAPFCGPCKLLDKVLRKVQPRYVDKVDFVRWNVNDKENTVELKKMFLASGNTLTKLPSLILFRDGQPIAVRPGFANEFQLDFWLEKSLPDVLEPTFDENGLKKVATPQIDDDLTAVLPERTMAISKIPKEEMLDDEDDDEITCNDEEECLEFLERTVWENRTVVPAFQGISARRLNNVGI